MCPVFFLFCFFYNFWEVWLEKILLKLSKHTSKFKLRVGLTSVDCGSSTTLRYLKWHVNWNDFHSFSFLLSALICGVSSLFKTVFTKLHFSICSDAEMSDAGLQCGYGKGAKLSLMWLQKILLRCRYNSSLKMAYFSEDYFSYSGGLAAAVIPTVAVRTHHSWLGICRLRLWHTTEKMRSWLNVFKKGTVRNEQMHLFISSAWRRVRKKKKHVMQQ